MRGILDGAQPATQARGGPGGTLPHAWREQEREERRVVPGADEHERDAGRARGALIVHFLAWWALAATPCILAHDQPLAALAAPLMPLVLVGIAADQVVSGYPQAWIAGLAALVLAAPVAWVRAWRQPLRGGAQLLGHVALLAWWVGSIAALGIAL